MTLTVDQLVDLLPSLIARGVAEQARVAPSAAHGLVSLAYGTVTGTPGDTTASVRFDADDPADPNGVPVALGATVSDGQRVAVAISANGSNLIIGGAPGAGLGGGGIGTPTGALLGSVDNTIMALTSLSSVAGADWSMKRVGVALPTGVRLGSYSFGGDTDAIGGTVAQVAGWAADTTRLWSATGASADLKAFATWRQAGSGTGAPANWVTGTAYKRGQQVVNATNLYQATADHTSSTVPADVDPWRLIGSTVIPRTVLTIRDDGGLNVGDTAAAGEPYANAMWNFIQPGATKDWFPAFTGSGMLILTSTSSYPYQAKVGFDGDAPSAHTSLATHFIIDADGRPGVNTIGGTPEPIGIYAGIEAFDKNSTAIGPTAAQIQGIAYVCAKGSIFATDLVGWQDYMSADRGRYNAGHYYYPDDQVVYGHTCYQCVRENGPGAPAPANGAVAPGPAGPPGEPTHARGAMYDANGNVIISGSSGPVIHETGDVYPSSAIWMHSPPSQMQAQEITVRDDLPILLPQNQITDRLNANGQRYGGGFNIRMHATGHNDVERGIYFLTEGGSVSTYLDGIVSSTNAKNPGEYTANGAQYKGGKVQTTAIGWQVGDLVKFGVTSQNGATIYDGTLPLAQWSATNSNTAAALYYNPGDCVVVGSTVYHDRLYGTPNWSDNIGGTTFTTYAVGEKVTAISLGGNKLHLYNCLVAHLSYSSIFGTSNPISDTTHWQDLGANTNKNPTTATDFWEPIGVAADVGKNWRISAPTVWHNLTAQAWANGVVTCTTANGDPHGYRVGDFVRIHSARPQKWNSLLTNRRVNAQPKVASVLDQYRFTIEDTWPTNPGGFGPTTASTPGKVQQTNQAGELVLYDYPPRQSVAAWAVWAPTRPWNQGVSRNFLWLGPTEFHAGAPDSAFPAPLFAVDASGNLVCQDLLVQGTTTIGATGGGGGPATRLDAPSTGADTHFYRLVAGMWTTNGGDITAGQVIAPSGFVLSNTLGAYGIYGSGDATLQNVNVLGALTGGGGKWRTRNLMGLRVALENHENAPCKIAVIADSLEEVSGAFDEFAAELAARYPCTSPGLTHMYAGFNCNYVLMPWRVSAAPVTGISRTSGSNFFIKSAHGFTAGMAIVFSGIVNTTGVTNTTVAYFISATGLTAGAFQVSATSGGGVITLGGGTDSAIQATDISGTGLNNGRGASGMVANLGVGDVLSTVGLPPNFPPEDYGDRIRIHYLPTTGSFTVSIDGVFTGVTVNTAAGARDVTATVTTNRANSTSAQLALQFTITSAGAFSDDMVDSLITHPNLPSGTRIVRFVNASTAIVDRTATAAGSASASIKRPSWTSVALAKGNHTVGVVGLSGTVKIDGIYHYVGNYDSGVQVHMLGRSGYTTGDFAALSGVAPQYSVHVTGTPGDTIQYLVDQGFHAVVFATGSNDLGTSNYQADMQSLVAITRFGLPLASTIIWVPESKANHPWMPALPSIAQTIAGSTSVVADMNTVVYDYATQVTGGFADQPYGITVDGAHYGQAGSRLASQLLLDVVDSAPRNDATYGGNFKAEQVTAPGGLFVSGLLGISSVGDAVLANVVAAGNATISGKLSLAPPVAVNITTSPQTVTPAASSMSLNPTANRTGLAISTVGAASGQLLILTNTNTTFTVQIPTSVTAGQKLRLPNDAPTVTLAPADTLTLRYSTVLGEWVTVAAAVAYSTTGTSMNAQVSGTAVLALSTFTGGIAGKAYTIGDIVRALKLSGIMTT